MQPDDIRDDFNTATAPAGTEWHRPVRSNLVPVMQISGSDAALLARVIGQARLVATRRGRRLPIELDRLHHRLVVFAAEPESVVEPFDPTSLIPVPQAARELGISEQHCRRIAPRFGGHQIGGRWYFTPAVINLLTEEQ